MGKPWNGAVVLVTGASSGIGREIARQMAPDAEAIALVARRRDRLEELAAQLQSHHPGLTVYVRPTDLTDLDDCASMVDEVLGELGRVEVLVNNAGFGDMGAFDLAPWEKLHKMIELNVTALTYLSHRLYPGMVERSRGGILNISSGFGLQWMPSFATYVGTKHYVTGFSECLHLEARRLGVTITQVCPGPVDTEFNQVADIAATPRISRITATQCARIALRGFARRRALVVPGIIMFLTLWLGSRMPRWFLRIFHRPTARFLRGHELSSE